METKIIQLTSKFTLVIAVIAGCYATPLVAQRRIANNDTATVNFVWKAAKGGMTEVAAGKLAQQKGKSATVRNFGSRMILDHDKANAHLENLAKTKSIGIPNTPAIDPDVGRCCRFRV